ncbi:hypothetical protein TSEDIMI_10192 [Tenacibaculum sediminilitoris]|uniref:hypothetical protein n=1 Tax=Tenacibaculum sediminilitoris TaxID=1820334 RepID=UPI0038966902
MKRRLFILLLFYSFLGFGQEYSVWLASVEYKDIRTLHYRHSYDVRLSTSPRGEFKTPVGIHIASTSSVDVMVGERATVPDVVCELYSNTIINKYDYLAAVSSSTLCVAEKLIEARSEVNNDYVNCFIMLLPHYVQPVDNSRAFSDFLFKTKENTFNTDEVVKVPEIIWKYDYDGKGFKDFPESIKHNFPMKATVGEVLVDENLEAGKTFRVKAIFDNSVLKKGLLGISEPMVSTNIFNFNIISSSPELKQNPPVSQSPSCNYRADGSLTLDFKRDLYTTEKLAVIIYQQNTVSGKYDVILDQKLDIESLEKINETTYRYQWTNNLPHGTYKLKYQTGEKGVGINPKDISWSNLVPVDVTIEETAKVDFSVISSADQNCFKVNDGYIDISATGEGSRTFLYQLKKDNVIQIFNGTNWVNYTGNNADNETWFPFTNTKTTRISKLNKGAYSVKVRDSEECLAK